MWKMSNREKMWLSSILVVMGSLAFYAWLSRPMPKPAETVIVEDAITVEPGLQWGTGIVGSELRADTKVAICSHSRANGGDCGFYGRGERKPSPLASDLLAINGVTAVGISHYRIVVRKAELFTWDELSPEIATVVEKVVAEKGGK